MRDINTIIREFAETAANPKRVLENRLKEGKKVIGCFPVYTPEPLVTALGMVPIGLWGGQVTPMVAGKYNPIYTCSIMRSCLEYGMTGVYKGLDGVIMPILCDTFRGMSSAWRVGVKDIPLIAFIHPQNRESSGAAEFMAEEYRRVCRNLEKIAGRELREEDLHDAMELYNERNRIMRTFAEEAVCHLDIITPVVRHQIMKSVRFYTAQEAVEKVGELVSVLKDMAPCEWEGKKAVLTGITAEPDGFLKLFEQNRIAVVADDLAQESRQYRTDYPQGRGAFGRLAMQWMSIRGCSLAHEEDPRSRGRMLVSLAEKYHADCVAVCLMKFCDIEEYDYPYLSKQIQEAGLSCLCLEIDQSVQDNAQSATKLQSYAEM